MPLIRRLDLRGQQLGAEMIQELIPRAVMDITKATEVAAEVIKKVRSDGVSAIRQLALEIDGFDPEPLRVSASELTAALNQLDPKLREVLELAIDRNREVSKRAMPEDFEIELEPGARVSMRYQPVDSVGLYAPGGKAVYPSSVIMNVVPAQVAKVPDIYLASPGQKEFDGRPHPTVLATAALLGVENVYCMGGPAAVAAFAYGLKEVALPPVRLITGPGNAFVAAAKRLVRLDVAIDSEAGTTEIMIIADQSADAKLVAADLISQAEHDESAAAVLVTDSQELIDEVAEQLVTQLAKTKHQDRISQSLSGQQSALVLVDSIEDAAEAANLYATEHLEIMTSDPGRILKMISNAGAIFVGDYSPVSLGDYLAGSNHVLPTGGAAKHSSGLSVHTFLRPQQVIEYSRDALSNLAEHLPRFAKAEDLPAHGEAVSKRFE
jgi:histidinol dehydrogenase